MTAAGAVNFVMKYPPGHELAGQSIERQAECSRCQQKFTQQRIDRSYLNSVYIRGKSHLEAFLQTCEVEVTAEGKEVWFPERCPSCTRSRLNPDPEYARMV
jgi:hypothetical protein